MPINSDKEINAVSVVNKAEDTTNLPFANYNISLIL